MLFHIFSDKPLDDRSGTVPDEPRFPPPVPPKPQNDDKENQNSNSL